MFPSIPIQYCTTALLVINYLLVRKTRETLNTYVSPDRDYMVGCYSCCVLTSISFTVPVLQVFPVYAQNNRKASCSTGVRLCCLPVIRSLQHFASACWNQCYVQCSVKIKVCKFLT